MEVNSVNYLRLRYYKAIDTTSMIQPLNNMDHSAPYYNIPLADFLKDVMIPNSNSHDLRHVPMAEPFTNMDVLDFNVDPSFDFDLDGMSIFPNFDHNQNSVGVRFDLDNLPPVSRSGYTTPAGHRGVALSAQAWKESLWHFNPVQEDHGAAEQLNLSLPGTDAIANSGLAIGASLCEQLNQASRDRVLAMILSTCDAAVVPKVVANFPSSRVLSDMIQLFLTAHLAQTDCWFHLSSFRPNEESPELLAGLICAGAVLSPHVNIRKVGFAVQEAVRIALSTKVGIPILAIFPKMVLTV
jgi:hypothetical protein